ncbi:Zn-ribbon domain-containing OB-fold protein [Streptodolium elevatio]
MSLVVPPKTGPDDAFFWDGVAQGRLFLARCATCRRVLQPPGPMCPSCGGVDREVFDAEPRGRLLSWVLPRHPPAALPEQEVVALVELTCGARLVTNLRYAGPDDLRMDLPVEMFTDTLDGVALPQARPERRPA